MHDNSNASVTGPYRSIRSTISGSRSTIDRSSAAGLGPQPGPVHEIAADATVLGEHREAAFVADDREPIGSGADNADSGLAPAVAVTGVAAVCREGQAGAAGQPLVMASFPTDHQFVAIPFALCAKMAGTGRLPDHSGLTGVATAWHNESQMRYRMLG